MIRRLRPKEAGLEKFLGSIEATVMLASWSGARTIPEIYKTIIRRDQDYAYNTIKTVAQRLATKGILIRQGNKYTPVHSNEKAFIAQALRDALLDLSEDFENELDEAIGAYYTTLALGGNT